MIRVAAVIALLIASPAAAQDAPNILGADKLADRCFGNAVDQLMCESYVSGWLAGALSGQRGLVAEFCPTATSTGRDLIETFLTEVRKDETLRDETAESALASIVASTFPCGKTL